LLLQDLRKSVVAVRDVQLASDGDQLADAWPIRHGFGQSGEAVTVQCLEPRVARDAHLVKTDNLSAVSHGLAGKIPDPPEIGLLVAIAMFKLGGGNTDIAQVRTSAVILWPTGRGSRSRARVLLAEHGSGDDQDVVADGLLDKGGGVGESLGSPREEVKASARWGDLKGAGQTLGHHVPFAAVFLDMPADVGVKGGQCPKCLGQGRIKLEMSFLPDVFIDCEACGGRRFTEETLQVEGNGRKIADVLEMTIEEAREFFSSFTKIHRPLAILDAMGLGYLTLGQASNTLSGGEAQRIKLADELSKPSRGGTLYILDEPTTGLHFMDIDKLVQVLHQLVDRGDTLVVVEHNLDFIREADHLIDLGPEGGEKGGRVVVEGSPFELMKNGKNSYTVQYLKKHLLKK